MLISAYRETIPTGDSVTLITEIELSARSSGPWLIPQPLSLSVSDAARLCSDLEAALDRLDVWLVP